MDQKFEDLLAQIRTYNPKADFGLINKAFQFAFKVHAGQKRLSGEDFINHPLSAAKALADWKLDSASIAAGLLHDVIEDGGVSKEVLGKEFGKEIADLVGGVSKTGELKLRGSEEENFVENLRKMIVVMAKDLRVVLIKLADRYHNLQTLYALSKEKQQRIARETLEIYAPLAERLGIGEMKGKLEDLAFPYIYPKEYQWVKDYSAPFYKKAEEFLVNVKRKLLRNLAKEGVKAQIHSRAKHLYSLYQKLLRPEIDKDISKIHDLVALRILVNTVEECYVSLGVVHKTYKMVPYLGVSDFIAVPKPNGYRSIHTKVFGPEGRIFEVQIRTYQMHEEAENGIAAHWYYGQRKTKGIRDSQLEKGIFAPPEKIGWVRQLVAWQKEIVDSKEFLKALKFDALAHRIFVFSPKGDVYDLPAGATPVDFAYAVHTEIGNSCQGAKVDGKLVPLNYKLKSGQIVEILQSKTKRGPSWDWLNFVVTRLARQEIEKHFRKR
ncbi:MAG: RelA/SpoT family protein [Microgenomates group bacterium]